jgi:hypothetical protein
VFFDRVVGKSSADFSSSKARSSFLTVVFSRFHQMMAASITTTRTTMSETSSPAVAHMSATTCSQKDNGNAVRICDRSSEEAKEIQMVKKQMETLLTSTKHSELTEWLVNTFMNKMECLQVLKQATEDAISQVTQRRASNSPEVSTTTSKLQKKPSLEEVVAQALTGLRQSEPIHPQVEQQQQPPDSQSTTPHTQIRITPKLETCSMNETTNTSIMTETVHADINLPFIMASQNPLDLWKNMYNVNMKMNMAAASAAASAGGNLLQNHKQQHPTGTTTAAVDTELSPVFVGDVSMDATFSPSSMTPVSSSSASGSVFSFVRDNGIASSMIKKCHANKAIHLMAKPLPIDPTDPVDTTSTATGSSVNLETAKVLMHRASRAQPTRKAVPRRWTKEEDEALRKAVRMHQEKNWKAIAARVPGRNHTQCLQRWTKVLAPGLVKGHWSKYEDDLLKSLVASENKNWGEVAAKIPGRTSKQCRERWHNHLDPSIIRGAYTLEEDRIIIEAQAKLGNRWSVIAAMLPGRTEDAVKIRWKSHCRLWKTKQQPDGTSIAGVTIGEKREREEEDDGTDDTDSSTCPSEPSSPTSASNLAQKQRDEHKEDTPCKKNLKTEQENICR